MERAAYIPVHPGVQLPEYVGLQNERLQRLATLLAREQESRRRTVTADGTFTEGEDVLLVDTTGGNIATTFPLASLMLGHQITIVKTVAANTATGTATGSDTITPALSLTANNHAVTYEAIEGGWRAVWDYNSAAAAALSDGDKGDITVSGGGTVWTVDAEVYGQTILASQIFGS